MINKRSILEATTSYHRDRFSLI